MLASFPDTDTRVAEKPATPYKNFTALILSTKDAGAKNLRIELSIQLI